MKRGKLLIFVYFLSVFSHKQFVFGSSIIWETDDDGFLLPSFDETESTEVKTELLPGQVKFLLYSRRFVQGIELFDQPGNKNLHIIGNYPLIPLKVIIHGWMANSSVEWVQNTKQAYLNKTTPRLRNVILVNWGELASDTKYYQSSQSTEMVGKRVAKFLDEIMKMNLARPKEIHLIGHSLGAHVAGVAGYRFNGTVGRITGLDPAKPGYELAERSEMLTEDDADLVDIIHSTAGTSGIYSPSGHLDFYPNGGTNQPGCDGFSPEIKSYLDSISCSHMRVCDFFIESIKTYPSFISKRCPDNVLIPPNKDDCLNGTEALMGENCRAGTNGIYYVETNEESPYSKST